MSVVFCESCESYVREPAKCAGCLNVFCAGCMTDHLRDSVECFEAEKAEATADDHSDDEPQLRGDD